MWYLLGDIPVLRVEGDVGKDRKSVLNYFPKLLISDTFDVLFYCIKDIINDLL